MDLPREQKRQQPEFDREAFLRFLISAIGQMRLPKGSFMSKEHPLLATAKHIQSIMDGIVPGHINDRYKTLQKQSTPDFFTHQITEIMEIGRANQNPALNYFYEFVKDTYLYSEGLRPLHQKFLDDKLAFLCDLKDEIKGFRNKNNLGVSEGIDKLEHLVSLLDKNYVDQLKAGKWSDNDRLFIYKLFQECKVVYQAKQDQMFKLTRHQDATAIYNFIKDALPRIEKEQKKTETAEEIIDSFLKITLSTSQQPQRVVSAEKPDLPPRRSTRSLSADPPRQAPPPLPDRRKSSASSSDAEPENPDNKGSHSPRG